MKELRSEVMPFCGIVNPSQFPTSCNVDLYEDGNSGANWHADNGGLFGHKSQEVRIISPSFGQWRSFETRPIIPMEGVSGCFFAFARWKVARRSIIATELSKRANVLNFESTSHGAGLRIMLHRAWSLGAGVRQE